MDNALTAAEIGNHLFGTCSPDDWDSQLHWPPNLLAFTSSVLQRSDAATRLVDAEEECDPAWLRQEWVSAVGHAARSWVDAIRDGNSSGGMPSPVKELLGAFKSGLTPTEAIGPQRESLECLTKGRHKDCLHSLLKLHAIADEACGLLLHGAAVSPDGPSDEARGSDSALPQAPAVDPARMLSKWGSLASLAVTRGRVLPKFHTPGVGMTIRSTTLHAAFDQSAVGVQWVEGRKHVGSRLNVLLIPWPFQVSRDGFSRVDQPRLTDGFGYFAYSGSRKTEDLDKVLRETLTVACRQLGMEQVDETNWKRRASGEGVDLVVLPEAAIADREVPESLRRILRQHDVMSYVFGLGDRAREVPVGTSRPWGVNHLEVGMTRHGHQVVDGEDKKFRFNTHKQRKHHRWCLDAGQIYSYALSGALDPAKKWWEAIEVSGRTLTVLELQRGLSVVPLICEDLARQEPMGTIVRSIGPSLVLALLMDGPQYRERWSGNYATVLADDPGSSVLTLTSRGMVERWNSPHAPSRSVVALWKEAGRPAVVVNVNETRESWNY